MEGDPTRISGSGSRGPLWNAGRGSLPVHADITDVAKPGGQNACRCSTGPGRGPGCPPARAAVAAVSHPGVDTDNGGEFINAEVLSLLRAGTHHLHARTSLASNDQCFVEVRRFGAS